jgi:hypothetical protein
MSSPIDSFTPAHFGLSACPVHVARIPAAPFAFATNDHFRESFEPATVRNLWLGIEPPRKQSELGSRNLAFSNSLDQMGHQRIRNAFAPDSRHRSSPVKACKNLLLQPVRFLGIFRRDHLIC